MDLKSFFEKKGLTFEKAFQGTSDLEDKRNIIDKLNYFGMSPENIEL